MEVLYDYGTWNIVLLAFENDTLEEVISSNWQDMVSFKQPTDYVLSRLVLCVSCNDMSHDDYEYFIFGNDIDISSIEINIIKNIELSSFPNPFNELLTIEVENSKNTEASVELFNISGQKVQTIFNGNIPAGKNSFEWNAENLSSGIYFIRLKSEDYYIERKCVLQNR
jgi:hypothetical protein